MNNMDEFFLTFKKSYCFVFVNAGSESTILKSFVLSRKRKSHYGARNRFQEASMELSSQATKAGGPVRQPYVCLLGS